MKAIDCGTLVDGVSDEPLRDAVVLVEDGRIAAVGPREAVAVPDDAERVDHSGEVVIPGLIDAHLHLKGWPSLDEMAKIQAGVADGAARATADLRELLAAGFTTVRDVDSRTGLGLRTAVEEGAIPGPRIYTSGQAFYQTAGHADVHYLPYDWVKDENPYDCELVDGEDECRKGARRRIRQGVDLLKIGTTGGILSEKDHPTQSQFTDAEIRAFTEEAHRVGIPVAAHAQGAEGIKNALRNGVDTVEHGIFVDDEGLDLLEETGGVLVPTLAIVHQLITDDRAEVPEFGLRKAREARETHFESIRHAYDRDAAIALGTDFVGAEFLPHGENAMEAELFVDEVGMSEMDAVKAATSVAARTVPDDDLGRVEVDCRADLVALDADPLADISALREDVAAVYKGGERVAP